MKIAKPNITEGEWDIEVFGSNYCVLTVQDDQFVDQICEMNDTVDAKQKANAKAIRSVPEMIDALIDMLKVAESEKWDISTTGRQIIYKQAINALKKAGCTYE